MNQHLQEPVIQPTINYSPHPTCAQFHQSNKYVRGLMGPIGSGKSVACCFEIFRRACEQKPGLDRKTRKSKWAAIRATYPQLEQTTIQTWMHWFGPITKLKMSSPITAKVSTPLGDGTIVDLEIVFLALDRPDDRSKLTSLELTGAWINEAREIDWSLVTEVPSRLGRFPNNDFLGRWTWKGMIMDTNPPDDDSDWYKVFEEECPTNWQLFRQPGALIPKPGKDGKYTYDRNPLAENIEAHMDKEQIAAWKLSGQPQIARVGYKYWEEMIGIERNPDGTQKGDNYSKPFDWINVMVGGNYGVCFDGKAVFKDTWNDATHYSKTPLDILKGVPIRLGWDFGYTHPACVIAQLSPRGQMRILREIIAENCDLKQFVKDYVRPVIQNEFSGFEVISDCDPSGIAHGQVDGISNLTELNTAGFPTFPAPGNNNIDYRLGAVNEFLLRMIGDSPGFIVDPSCTHLRKGFNGGYHFKRVQVGGKAIFRDKPDKNEYSHCLTGDSMISMKDGLKRIDQVNEGDEVLTPIGYKKVLKSWKSGVNQEVFEVTTSNGSKVRATANHRFFANKTWIPLDSLQYNDVLYTPTSKECLSWELLEDLQNTQFKNLTESSITSSAKGIIRLITTFINQLAICTGTFGRFITGLSRTATKFTTLMRIKPIIPSKTLQLCYAENTHPCTVRKDLSATQKNTIVGLWRQERQQKRGIVAQRERLGIANTPRKLWKKDQEKPVNVSCVEMSILGWLGWRKEDFAGNNTASKRPDTFAEWIMLREIVLSAIKFLSAIRTQKQRHAVRIVQIKPLEKRTDVYDLEVEDAHCFFANGILVHNCQDATQYICSRAVEHSNKFKQAKHKPQKKFSSLAY